MITSDEVECERREHSVSSPVVMWHFLCKIYSTRRDREHHVVRTRDQNTLHARVFTVAFSNHRRCLWTRKYKCVVSLSCSFVPCQFCICANKGKMFPDAGCLFCVRTVPKCVRSHGQFSGLLCTVFGCFFFCRQKLMLKVQLIVRDVAWVVSRTIDPNHSLDQWFSRWHILGNTKIHKVWVRSKIVHTASNDRCASCPLKKNTKLPMFTTGEAKNIHDSKPCCSERELCAHFVMASFNRRENLHCVSLAFTGFHPSICVFQNTFAVGLTAFRVRKKWVLFRRI